MEAIIALPHHPVLTRWLDYVMEQLDTTDFEASIFKEWKMRYVMHTTGPHSLNRFLKAKAQQSIMADMTFIACNVQKMEHKMTGATRASMDVISYDCCSWKDGCDDDFTVDVTGNTVSEHSLPVLRIIRRVPCKTNQMLVMTSNRYNIVDEVNRKVEAVLKYEHAAVAEFVTGIGKVLGLRELISP